MLLVLAAIVVVLLPLSRAYDLNVFLRAGGAVLHSEDVYPAPSSRAVYSGSAFVYPYLTVLPFVGLAALSWHAGGVLFFACSVSAVLLACTGGDVLDPLRAPLVLCTSFTITGLQLGAISPLLLGGVVLLWRARGDPLVTAAVAAPLVISKLFLAPMLAWLILARRWRGFAYASLGSALLLALGFALGPLGPLGYLRLLSQLARHEAGAGFGLTGLLMHTGLAAPAAEAAAAAAAASLLAASFARWRRHRDERVLFCGCIVACLFITPVLWSHYLVLLAAPLLVLEAPRRWFVALALLSWLIAPPHGVHGLDLNHVAPLVPGWLALLAALSVFGASVAPSQFSRLSAR